MADPTATVDKPHDWDKAVAAAYLRLIGLSQKAAAKGAGVGERTVERWEKSAFWPTAVEEAKGRWLKHLDYEARRGLIAGVETDGALALKVLERIEPALAPPKVRGEFSGPNGGPVEHTVVHVYLPDNNRAKKPSTNGTNGGKKRAGVG